MMVLFFNAIKPKIREKNVDGSFMKKIPILIHPYHMDMEFKKLN